MFCTIEDAAGPWSPISRPREIFAAGDTCHVVIEGVLAHCQSLANGKSQIVSFHLPGDICGLSSIGSDLRDTHIRSLMPSVTAHIPAGLLTDLASRSPAFGRALLRQMSVDAAISRQWITNLGQRSAALRIGHLACELARRLDAIGLVEDSSFSWFGTQSDLGAAMGLSLVHVNKSLRRLREEGLVAWTKTVEILDLNRLQAVVGFDPCYLGLSEQKLGHLLLEIETWEDLAQPDLPVHPAQQSVFGTVSSQ